MKKLLALTCAMLMFLLGVSCADASTGFSETEITVGADEWELPGTLTMPDGNGPFPLVVFVHGSGPADRDETVGKQKLFRDLAADLAEQGIASIRYDKRTYVYNAKIAADLNLTVREETIDDALAAVALALTTAKIDPAQIYIAGHSMGGYLIPRIDAADTAHSVAGYISLAGAARGIMELTLEQIDYLLSLETTMSDADKATYRQSYQTAADAVNALTEANGGSATAIMGAYPTYWLDLADYHPAEEAVGVAERMLFLQGEHDYQVTMTDFGIWKEALEATGRATFISYPTLTHCFTETAEMSKPTDYNTYAEVDAQVAADIAAWIRAEE